LPTRSASVIIAFSQLPDVPTNVAPGCRHRTLGPQAQSCFALTAERGLSLPYWCSKVVNSGFASKEIPGDPEALPTLRSKNALSRPREEG
jgi:hypothetical protein